MPLFLFFLNLLNYFDLAIFSTSCLYLRVVQLNILPNKKGDPSLPPQNKPASNQVILFLDCKHKNHPYFIRFIVSQNFKYLKTPFPFLGNGAFVCFISLSS